MSSGRDASPFGDDSGMELEVARAAEKPRPRKALDIYRRLAERLIQQQGRASYREACKFLKKVRALHQALGEGAAWGSYVARLRERHPRLRALHEELAAARL